MKIGIIGNSCICSGTARPALIEIRPHRNQNHSKRRTEMKTDLRRARGEAGLV